MVVVTIGDRKVRKKLSDFIGIEPKYSHRDFDVYSRNRLSDAGIRKIVEFYKRFKKTLNKVRGFYITGNKDITIIYTRRWVVVLNDDIRNILREYANSRLLVPIDVKDQKIKVYVDRKNKVIEVLRNYVTKNKETPQIHYDNGNILLIYKEMKVTISNGKLPDVNGIKATLYYMKHILPRIVDIYTDLRLKSLSAYNEILEKYYRRFAEETLYRAREFFGRIFGTSPGNVKIYIPFAALMDSISQ